MMSEKSKWPDGPWMKESDHEAWRDTATGLPCIVHRNSSLGFLCGYVAVPPGHPWHGRGYDDVPVDVHGGLTYSNACSGHICHVPDPGESDDVWWLGFDCGHAFDLAPGMEAIRIEKSWPLHADDVYCDMIYVKAEVARLAEQVMNATRIGHEEKEDK